MGAASQRVGKSGSPRVGVAGRRSDNAAENRSQGVRYHGSEKTDQRRTEERSAEVGVFTGGGGVGTHLGAEPGSWRESSHWPMRRVASGSASDSHGLQGFEQALADLGCTLGGRRSFTLGGGEAGRTERSWSFRECASFPPKQRRAIGVPGMGLKDERILIQGENDAVFDWRRLEIEFCRRIADRLCL